MTREQIENFGNLVIPLTFENMGPNVTSMTIIERDKSQELCLYEMNFDDELENIIFASRDEWTIMTSKLFNTCIKLAIADLPRNTEDLIFLVSNLDPSYGVRRISDELFDGNWNFRIGPKLCVAVSMESDNEVIINIIDCDENLGTIENHITLTTFTWNFIQEHHADFSSFVKL